MDKTVFLCHPVCTTCDKARKWLVEQGIEYEERDIRMPNPTVQELRTWLVGSGLPVKRFFNTSGLLYRSLGLSEKLAGMSVEEQIDQLAADGMLVKRPIVLLNNGHVLVGFKETEWASAFQDLIVLTE